MNGYPMAPPPPRYVYPRPPAPAMMPSRPGVFGAAFPAEIELGPTTLQTINDTRRTLEKKIDVLSNEVSAAVKIATVGIVVAAIAIGVGLAVRK